MCSVRVCNGKAVSDDSGGDVSMDEGADDEDEEGEAVDGSRVWAKKECPYGIGGDAIGTEGSDVIKCVGYVSYGYQSDNKVICSASPRKRGLASLSKGHKGFTGAIYEIENGDGLVSLGDSSRGAGGTPVFRMDGRFSSGLPGPKVHRESVVLVGSGGSRDQSEDDKVSVSLFVDNIPPNTSRRWIWQDFGRFGKVCGIFISRKHRKFSRNLFGFVRFCYKRDVVEAMGVIHGMCIADQKLVVNFALLE